MTTKKTWALALALTLPLAHTAHAEAPKPAPLRVGVTLHPYYSWAQNVVAGTGIEVVSVLPGEVDVGSYQPRAEDIQKLAKLDALVVNGLGHDDFIRDMVKASGNKALKIIEINAETPLIRAEHGGAPNSHTFISFTNAVQQTYVIQKALAELRPEHTARMRKNAAAYAQRMRALKKETATALAKAKVKRAVTVHDGYSYLLQEFGLEVARVVEPAHGLVPSAAELQALVKDLKAEGLRVVFSEETFPEPLVNVLRDAAGARVYVLSHVATGEYTADKFEVEMAKNAAELVRALVTDG
ncbi:zinc ABC transporter substrate-binding protein [Myxococcota bacterium]|nr:zinc ABC transporter substrate-binding protein [Myxococcota bacterium]